MRRKGGRRSRRDSHAMEDDGDPLAEKVLEMADAAISRQALYVGKVMLRNGMPDGIISYAVDSFDKMELSSRGRSRASSLLRRWTLNNKVPFFLEGPIHHVDARKNSLRNLFEALPALVKSREMYRITGMLMRDQSSSPVPSLEEDLVSLSASAHLYPALAKEVRDFFWDVVSDAVGFNRSSPFGQTRRYNNLGNVLFSLAPFACDHHPRSYGLLRSIKSKDRKNILFGFYTYVGELSSDCPENVMDFTEKVIGYLPENGSLADDDVRKVDMMMRRIVRSFEEHEPFEVGCFLELCTSLYEESKDDISALDTITSLLDGSRILRGDDFSPREVSEQPDGNMKAIRNRESLEDRIHYIALEYLDLSHEIMQKHGGAKARQFADRVLSLGRCGLGPGQVLETMQLYKKVIIDDDSFDVDEDEKRLGPLLLLSSKAETKERAYRREYEAAMKRGPVPCPDYLREHLRDYLMKEFRIEVDVELVWDFRKNQAALYTGKEAAETYEQLSRKQTDPDFVKKVVRESHDMQMLEGHIVVVGGGCGNGKTEILFYEELKALGYDVHLDLIDRSDLMLEKAFMNCERKGIKVDTRELDLEKLTTNDLRKDRQVILTHWGKTFFNWLERYKTAKKYHEIFTERDRMDDGVYELPRFFGEEGRKRDVLLIDGDTEKDINYYMSTLSKLFLARGLRGEYSLTQDALMRDGRLCHTTYLHCNDEKETMELQCIYVVTKDLGPFREDHAILVIDSGTLHKDAFPWHMAQLDWNTHLIEGPNKTAVALCTTNENKEGCSGCTGR